MHFAAQPAQHLFVEDRRRTADKPLVDDEPNRVRADIDDRDRPPERQASRRLVLHGLRRGRFDGRDSAAKKLGEIFHGLTNSDWS